MIYIKSALSEKDRKIIKGIIYDIPDIYGDCYITQENLRLSLRENSHLLFNLLSKGDKIVFDEKGQGLAFIQGFAEKSDRKYLKLLIKNLNIADKLIKNIDWNISSNIYIKIKKNNPVKSVLLRNKFKFKGNRGSEILLYKEGKVYKKYKSEKDNEENNGNNIN